MDLLDWLPFVKAAIERNPVCLGELNGKDEESVFGIISDLPGESIYDGKRLSLPDEVWNFGRGDGAEKAFLFADYLAAMDNKALIIIKIEGSHVKVEYKHKEFIFRSGKGLNKRIEIKGSNYRVS
jgi:hypothetical protein